MNVIAKLLPDGGAIPNNPKLPLLLYQDALALDNPDPAAAFERLFHEHEWRRSWRNGVYSFPHYHSTAHEVLGVFSGSAQIRLGGEGGIVQEIRAGDVVVLPAGTGHEKINSTRDFGVVGAYPPGPAYDMCYGKLGERPEADRRIAATPLPSNDPVFGEAGPLIEHWHHRSAL